MLIRQGDARSEDIDRRLACTLAGVAGALNAAAFHAVGFFSANMTGNVSDLSNNLALANFSYAGFFLLVVLVFIGGATVSTLLINAGRRRHVFGIYAFSILTEAILLALLGCAVLWLPGVHRAPTLILGLSFLMGLQNAVVTRISDARVRTTHISGLVTDIGIELAMLLDIARGRELASDAVQYRSRLRLHSQTVAAFLVGGIGGVMIYQIVGDLLLLGMAAILFGIALTGLIRLRTQNAT